MDKDEVNVACANQELELRASYKSEVAKNEVPHDVSSARSCISITQYWHISLGGSCAATSFPGRVLTFYCILQFVQQKRSIFEIGHHILGLELLGPSENHVALIRTHQSIDEGLEEP